MVDRLISLYIEKRGRWLHSTTASNPLLLIDDSPSPMCVTVLVRPKEKSLEVVWQQERVTSTHVIGEKADTKSYTKDLAWKRLTRGT
jgi:hypothetical protein